MKLNGWQGHIAALIAGAVVPYSLAPYDIWPLGIFGAGLLSLLLQNLNGKQAFARSFFFGLGLFGIGASWVYVAIHDFGLTQAPLAVVLTSLFVSGLALVFAIPFAIYRRYFPSNFWSNTLGFAAIWVLGEWSRSWFLTGFPWLYIGYAHIETPLAGWAPIVGIFGISLFCALTGAWLCACVQFIYKGIQEKQSQYVIYTFLLLFSIGICFGAGYGFSKHNWLKPSNNKRLNIAIVQPNIPLEIKWNPLFRDDIMATLREETDQHWDKDLILWPEAAVPLMYHDAQNFLSEMHEKASATNTGIILGILYDDEKPDTFYNSIIGIGHAEGMYFKQRLVPFGEYVPLEHWLRGIIAFFDLPNSVMFAGQKDQDILSFKQDKIAPSICYEIVYPDLVARLAKDAGLLITISNDAWFGDSIGPMQHFQMAQMRALENQRYVLRSTNTGISGIIDPKGKVRGTAPKYTQNTTEYNNITLNYGHTPFAQYGSTPVVVLCFLSLFLLIGINIRNKHTNP